MSKSQTKMNNIIMYCLFIIGFWSVQNVLTQTVPPISQSNETTEDTSSCSNITGNAAACVTPSEVPSTTEEVISSETSTTFAETNESAAFENTTETIVTTAAPENSTTSINMSTESNITKVPSSTATPESTTIASTTMNTSTTTIPLSSTSTRVLTDLCSCDLTMHICDINCCCDPDCSDSDRVAFSGCDRQPANPIDPRFCYQTHFIYHNNTELKMVELKDDLFCILKANHPADFNYENRRTVVLLNELDGMMKTTKTYSWSTNAIPMLEFIQSQSHKAGEIVWALKNNSLVPLEIPVSVMGGLCQTYRAIQYLQDFKSSCSQLAPSADDCETKASFDAANYYHNLTTVSISDQYNETVQTFTAEHCFNNSCIPVQPFLCPASGSGLESLDACVSVVDISSPMLNKSMSTCSNVVRHVRYVIQHNSTGGIVNVSAFITLSTVSVSYLPHEQFRQSFVVEFVWLSTEKTTFKRSGRPGYVVGKPVIAGRKVSHHSKEENSVIKEAIELSYNSNDWLGLPAVTKQGMCHDSLRQSVTFGESRRSVCLIPLQVTNFTSITSCALIQKQVLELLAGDAINNVTQAKNVNLYVATFGDSVVEETGDWVRVVLESIPSIVTTSSSKHNNRVLICKSLVTSLHIDIVFANVGALANPQAKILGVAFRFGPLQDLSFDCNPVQCSTISNETVKYFQVTNTVSFVDATKPVIPHFLEPPVYEVKLPHDFFYPFFSASVMPKLDYLVFVGALSTKLIHI